MDLNELLTTLWRRKLTVTLLTVAAVGLAVGALRLVTPQYESTATIALSPKDLQNGIFLLGSLDAIVPVYADAATSRTTRVQAETATGLKLADVSVKTYKGTPIIKISGRSTNKRLAQQTAAAITDVVLARAGTGEIGIPALKVTQLDRPTVPSTAVFPRTKLTLIVAGLLGLGLGIGAALLRENLTTKIETADELARTAGVPCFAEIPQESAVAALHAPDELVSDKRFRIVSEALRELRTNLLFSEEQLRSIVVTSPDGSHGKTTVAFGLAATFARAGAKTLLVDGDLRRGRIAELLDIRREPGLTDALQGMPIGAVASRTALPTLDVISGGRRRGNPEELLTTQFPDILERLESAYDVVIIDSTPVSPISDARIMARYADATLLVATSGSVTRRQIRSAVERLSLIAVKPLAVVFNKSRRSTGSRYYDYLHEVPEDTPPADEDQRRERRRARAGRRSTAPVRTPRLSGNDD